MKFEDFPYWQLESTLEKIAPTDLNVLISGEPGTFKQRVAQRVFEKSSLRKGRFEKLDAQSFRLDEILTFGTTAGDLCATLYVARVQDLRDKQQKRLLQAAERESSALANLRTNCRIIAASDVDLMDRVRRGGFRSDLFFRICEVEIRVPSLRENSEFIPELLDELLSRRGRTGSPITVGQYDLVRNYPWPGNLQELERFADRVAGLSDPAEAFVDLHRRFKAVSSRSPLSLSLSQIVTLTRQRAEQKAVARALQQTSRDRIAAAKLLGISLRRLDGIDRRRRGD